jgi:hypothetical protein
MSPEARERSFDELARGLASGSISRGRALRLMGAALVGGSLASIPGIAWAKPKPAGGKCNHNHQCESGNCSGGICQFPVCQNPLDCTESTDCCPDSFCDAKGGSLGRCVPFVERP